MWASSLYVSVYVYRVPNCKPHSIKYIYAQNSFTFAIEYEQTINECEQKILIREIDTYIFSLGNYVSPIFTEN